MSTFGAAEYLGHQLLLHHQEQRGLVPKTVFHKLWCISDHHLSGNYGIDIGLPRYWYMYGEMVDEVSVDTGFRTAPSAPWGGQAYKPDWDLERSDFDITDEQRELIDSTVTWTLNRFDRRETRYLEFYQYQTHSPNDFIRAYSELRAHLQYVNLDVQDVLTPLAIRPGFEAESNEELIEAYLDEMLITYPENIPVFADFQTIYLRWDDTARLLLNETDAYAEFDDFLDRFIEALSKDVLKLTYHDDIPPERLEQWEAEADEATAEFESYLAARRSSLLETRELSGTLEDVSETFDETVLSDLEGNG